MAYLFMVAEHTTWVLDLVGDRAELEPHPPQPASVRRAELAEWRGATEPGASAQTEAASSDGPLTAWESWLHKAYATLREARSLQETGPTVRFVKREGLAERQRETREQLKALQAKPPPETAADRERVEALHSRFTALKQQEESIPAGPERVAAMRGVEFSFRVVPDCGAIPSMSIFLAAVLAFPALIWKRVVGAVGGLVILYGINILRLATLGYIGAIDRGSNGKWFSFVHEYLWQGIFIIFVVAVWMAWIEFVVRPRRA